MKYLLLRLQPSPRPIAETAVATIWPRISRPLENARMRFNRTPLAEAGRDIISPKHVRPRARVFYVRLIMPKCSRRGSPASQRRIGDAHQTSWHGRGDGHVGRTRPCGGGPRSSELREPWFADGWEYTASRVDRHADLACRRYLDVPRELDTARRVCRGSDVGEPVSRRKLDPHGRVRGRLPIQCDGSRVVPSPERVQRRPGWRIHELLDLAVVSARPRECDGGRLRVVPSV